MSLKQRWFYSYHSFLDSVAVVTMPEWMFSVRTKVVLFSLMVITALAYLIQINTLSTSGYVIHTLEQKVAVVTVETQKLETEVAAHQSMISIQKRLPELAMQKTSKVTYIEHIATPVAQR